ncbi:helix-turn-helix transcriptional regulator [Martelella alba]|uniref:LuxR family transcriptional regulator n=1 Tax=Martelella alba TaxID=2590451 RepID=A0ABY2SRK2_9HYPH|nr:LuxR family transcriptional regulator [Martelella alba]TKI06706.1 LuxR family transcriptional regulator [Martelella alba]
MRKELRFYLIQIFKHAHVFCFAYLMMNKSHYSSEAIISDYPAGWIEQYQNYGYQKIDPVMLVASRTVSPFIWPDDLTLSRRHSFYRLSNYYRLNSGYTFTLHDGDDNLATLSLINLAESPQFFDTIEQNKEKFQMLLITTHEKVINFLRSNTAYPQTNGVPPFEPHLSPREKEVLYWASAGKTYGEVATILTIREGTVKFHIRNVIEKMGVANAKHAISRAMKLKLFG